MDDKGAIATPHYDFGEAPDSSIFYGRTNELATLTQWIVRDNCRLLLLLGMGGIGKTALSIKLAQQIENEFEYVIWRSLRHAPPLEEILANLLQSLSGDRSTNNPTTIVAGISQLIDYLRKHRCLLILDDWQAVLRGGEIAGSYLEGYDGYGDFLRQIGTSAHQSCLSIVSREKPQEIVLLGKAFPVRFLELQGLQAEDAKKLLEVTGLSSSDNGLEKLIKHYGSNPLALMLISASIQEVFDGNVLDFIKHSRLIGDIMSNLLSQHFSRLAKSEKEIMYGLAIEQKPVSAAQLNSDIWFSVNQSQVLINLESLRRRSLIEKISESDTTLFTLQPIVMKYVTLHLNDKICQDIFAFVETCEIESLGMLRSLKLFEERDGEETLKANQIRLILKPIKDRLGKIFSGEKSLDEKLNDMLRILQEKSPQAVGYAVSNLQLLVRSESELK